MPMGPTCKRRKQKVGLSGHIEMCQPGSVKLDLDKYKQDIGNPNRLYILKPTDEG